MEHGDGITRDLSLSGVYFRAERAPAGAVPGRPIDFSICVADGLGSDTHLHCHGLIVRVDQLPNDLCGVAATIGSFWFEEMDGESGCPRCRERRSH